MIDEQKDFINKLKKGDEKTYRLLYDRYYVMLCKTAYQYVPDIYLSESFVNDVIFHLWEQRTSINIHTSLKNYLVKSVINMCIKHINKEKREQSLDDVLISRFDDYQLSDPDAEYPLNELMFNDLKKTYHKALALLPEECREVFRLSRMEELSYPEIADKLNISVNTVKYHIKNALAKLRELLKDYLVLLFIM
ncbi:MAG: RNA polymerase sigma-70 factor [Tannerella sp.]|jgi:RNA polymerase sigma-70 factor (ECF subfamily)|nr:RNA polymerase sigma-70 factor [Tannerella sp.]